MDKTEKLKSKRLRDVYRRFRFQEISGKTYRFAGHLSENGASLLITVSPSNEKRSVTLQLWQEDCPVFLQAFMTSVEDLQAWNQE